jgi:hypothetical protein
MFITGLCKGLHCNENDIRDTESVFPQQLDLENSDILESEYKEEEGSLSSLE